MKLLLLTQDFPPRPGGMARYYADLARGLGSDCMVAAGSWEGRPPGREGDHDLLPLPFDAGASHRAWNLYRAGARTRSVLRSEDFTGGSVGTVAVEALTIACGEGETLVRVGVGVQARGIVVRLAESGVVATAAL